MKIKTYIQQCGQTYPFCRQLDLEKDPYIVKTADFQDALTMWILYTYGRANIFKYITREDEDDETTEMLPSDVWVEISKICENIYSVNKYEYEKLYNTTILEYDPIENYNKVEDTSESTNFSSSETTSLSTSEQGSESNSHSEQGSETATEAVIPIQNQGYNDKSKDTKNDSRSASEEGSHNVASSSSGENGKEEDFSRTFKSVVKGNIGTMTTQQMIASERRDVAMFNFIAIVARDIMQKIMSTVVVLDY